MNRSQKLPSKFGVFEPIVAMMRPPTASEYAGTAFREWSTKTQRPCERRRQRTAPGRPGPVQAARGVPDAGADDQR